jgi:hypothetical protein
MDAGGRGGGRRGGGGGRGGRGGQPFPQHQKYLQVIQSKSNNAPPQAKGFAQQNTAAVTTPWTTAAVPAPSATNSNNAPPRGGGSARGGRPQQQQQPEPIHKAPQRNFAIVRNVTLPERLDSWARSPDGKASLVASAIGVGDVSFFAGMIKLHGDDLEEVDRAVRFVHHCLPPIIAAVRVTIPTSVFNTDLGMVLLEFVRTSTHNTDESWTLNKLSTHFSPSLLTSPLLHLVTRQALLVEAVLDHRLRLQQRLTIKERLDAERAKVTDEIERGGVAQVECTCPIARNRLVSALRDP